MGVEGELLAVRHDTTMQMNQSKGKDDEGTMGQGYNGCPSYIEKSLMIVEDSATSVNTYGC